MLDELNREVFKEVVRSLYPKTVPVAQQARALARLLLGDRIVLQREVVVEGIEPVYCCTVCGGFGQVPDPTTQTMDDPNGEPMPCKACSDEELVASYELCRQTPGWAWIGLGIEWAFNRSGDDPLPPTRLDYDGVQLAHPETEEVVYDRRFPGKGPIIADSCISEVKFGNNHGRGVVLAAAVMRLPQLGPVDVACERFHQFKRRCPRCGETKGGA